MPISTPQASVDLKNYRGLAEGASPDRERATAHMLRNLGVPTVLTVLVTCIGAGEGWSGDWATEFKAFGATREERVGRNRDAPLLVDLGDGATKRAQRTHALLQEESEHVALQGGDLLADDHREPIRRKVSSA